MAGVGWSSVLVFGEGGEGLICEEVWDGTVCSARDGDVRSGRLEVMVM